MEIVMAAALLEQEDKSLFPLKKEWGAVHISQKATSFTATVHAGCTEATLGEEKL